MKDQNGTFDWAAVLRKAAAPVEEQPPGGAIVWGIAFVSGLAFALLLFYWWSS